MPTENDIPVYTEDQINQATTVDTPVESSVNPTFIPGPNTQVFDDGSSLQSLADGTTIATAVDGTVTTNIPVASTLSAGESIVNNPATPADPGSIDTTARQSGASATADTTLTDWQKEVNRTQATTDTPINGNRSGVPKGAIPNDPVAANAQWAEAKDLRAKLRVPAEYLIGPGAGPSSILKTNGGILFPYTPQISMQNQATYAQNTPLHSNYPLYFFKNGSVGPIQITAKFTVQNEFEGAVLLGIIHVLRGLTKMKWGNDLDAGAPPPVCRFDAYGDYMMQNVPVAITSWRHELQDNCDYIAVGRPGSPGTYGHSMIPTMSTITIDMNVMYSRQEMLAYNVKQWQQGNLVGKGYL
jgi:hypothetical protein